MRILCVFFLSISFLYANIKAYNGTALVLEFKEGVSQAFLGKKSLHFLPHPSKKDKKILLIPISYYQKSDMHLSYKEGNKDKSIKIEVLQKAYKKEFLKVDSSKVKPPKSELKRISKEFKEATKIYSTFTKKRYWTKPFENPLDATITSAYGNARVFNGELKSFHTGTDFRAKMGTPIKAANDGVVVLSKKRYYAGGSVIIDHGEGLYTCYYHLSSMPLKVGTRVKRGEVIALSGKSGRVTGPHLHFTVMLDGLSVDSQEILSRINSLFRK